MEPGVTPHGQKPSILRERSLIVNATIPLALAAITFADYATGYEMGFFVFYFLPVAMAAWFRGRSAGLVTALAGAVCWCLSDILSGHPYSRVWLVYWEASIHLASFVIVSLLVAGARARLEQERRLGERLRAALSEVRTLKGLIPVCSYCRRIRNDDACWDRFEAYLAAHTDVQFTHGICPDCYEKMAFEDGSAGAAG